MGVLTGEQRAQLEAQKAEWGGALTRLGLGDDQKAQLQARREQHRQQMSALKASEEVGREQMRALRAQYREAFKAVLTEEQREQLEELRAERESQGELRRSGRRGWNGRGGASGGDGGESGGGPVTATGLNSPRQGTLRHTHLPRQLRSTLGPSGATSLWIILDLKPSAGQFTRQLS